MNRSIKIKDANMLVVPIQRSGQKMASAGDGGDIPGRSVFLVVKKLAVLCLATSAV